MKILVTLAITVFLVVAAALYFGSGDLDIASKKAAAGPRQDFHAITALLEHDMSVVPVALDAPRVVPANAFSVKSRLGNAGIARPEYQVLAQACDLIIYADQERAVRQMNDQQAQRNVSGDLMASASTQQAFATSARTALHTKAQADWENYRRKTDSEVKRLLASLQDAKL